MNEVGTYSVGFIFLAVIFGGLIRLGCDFLSERVGRLPAYSLLFIVAALTLGLALFYNTSFLHIVYAFFVGMILYTPLLIALSLVLIWWNPAKYKERANKRRMRAGRQELENK